MVSIQIATENDVTSKGVMGVEYECSYLPLGMGKT